MKNYKIIKIDDRTTIIEDHYFGAPCYMYLVEGEKKALLIDAGFGFGNLKGFVETLTTKPLDVVNTHGHFDHIGANYQFEKIHLCKNEKEVLKLHQDKNYLSKEVLPWFARILFYKKVKNLTNPKLGGEYEYISEDFKFDLGNRSIEIIETPGHSEGSICLIDRENKMLFSGDTVCDIGILLNLEGSTSPEIFYESTKKLKEQEKDFTDIYPGHHKKPIDVTYLDDYIICAKQIIHGDFERSNDKFFKGAKYNKISIALFD